MSACLHPRAAARCMQWHAVAMTALPPFHP